MALCFSLQPDLNSHHYHLPLFALRSFFLWPRIQLVVSLWGFHCESTTSLASEISETHTHSDTQTHAPTFIRSRQLAMEYMTRLRRDLHSFRDAINRKETRWKREGFNDFLFSLLSLFGYSWDILVFWKASTLFAPPSLSLQPAVAPGLF